MDFQLPAKNATNWVVSNMFCLQTLAYPMFRARSHDPPWLIIVFAIDMPVLGHRVFKATLQYSSLEVYELSPDLQPAPAAPRNMLVNNGKCKLTTVWSASEVAGSFTQCHTAPYVPCSNRWKYLGLTSHGYFLTSPGIAVQAFLQPRKQDSK